jgi:hypothetical protein
MTRHYPIVIETEDNGDVSAYVAGLPIYAQAPTEAQAVKDITSMLGSYFVEHPREADLPRAAKLVVARVETKLRRAPHRMDFLASARIAIVSAAALVGVTSSPRKAASSRANGLLGGRPRRRPA